MSFESMKKQVVSAAGLVALLSAGQAMATNIDPGTGNYTFQGSGIEVTKTIFGFPVTLSCNVELDGAVDVDGNGTVFIDVTGGRMLPGGDSNCSQVDLQFSAGNWFASEQGTSTAGIPEASLPSPRLGTVITGQFNNVQVDTPLGYCSGSIVVSYSNGATIGAPSSFSFTNAALGTSGCTMDGVFEATTDVDVWQ